MPMCDKVTHKNLIDSSSYSECQIQLFLITVSGNFILRVDYKHIGVIMYLYIKYNLTTKAVSYGNHYQQ